MRELLYMRMLCAMYKAAEGGGGVCGTVVRACIKYVVGTGSA